MSWRAPARTDSPGQIANRPTVPALVVDPPADELAEIQQARESNEASETVVKTTFIDDAELVWKLTESFTQEQAAKAMGGWSREAVKNYKSLQKIDEEAWKIIGTGFQNIVPEDEDEGVPQSGTGVPKSSFSENLLRNILDLEPGQQVELCGYLAKGKDKKGHAYNKAKFKQDAVWYRAFNILWDLSDKQLSAAIPKPACSEYLTKVQGEIKANSEYTDEWLKNKAPGDKFNKLIQAQIDDWQQKNNVKIIVKDIRLLTADDITSESVDCIITDRYVSKTHRDKRRYFDATVYNAKRDILLLIFQSRILAWLQDYRIVPTPNGTGRQTERGRRGNGSAAMGLGAYR